MWTVTALCVIASFFTFSRSQESTMEQTTTTTLSPASTTIINKLRHATLSPIATEIIPASPTELPYLALLCTNAEQLAICRENLFNSTQFVPAENKETFCKTRSDFSICLEEAICTCQYPDVHPILETAYKDLMRNNYEFFNESCEHYQTNYTVKPGITCPQTSHSSNDLFRIRQTTSEQPFILSLKENCSALEACFTQRDRDFEKDLFNKSLSSYCRHYDVFLKCFEMKACECQMETDQSMLLVDDLEKRLFVETCSTITGVHTVIPEIVCGGPCSLLNPGIKCTREFEKNNAVSKGEEDFCRNLVAYAECYNKLVCQCSLFQEQYMYTAVSIAKYTFEVRSDCKRFPGIAFPYSQSGFLCPNDTQIPSNDRVLHLNTSKDEFLKAEEEVCPGITDCYATFDSNGSLALYNKDLKAVCQAMLDEIKCIEETTCGCGILQTRFSSILREKQNGLASVCGQSAVIEMPHPFICVEQTTAVSVKMDTQQLSSAEGQNQWSSKCPEVTSCSSQYELNLEGDLNFTNSSQVCFNTKNMIHCSQKALNKCNLLNTTEAATFHAVLLEKLVGCDTGNTTDTNDQGISDMETSDQRSSDLGTSDQRISNFGTDAVIGVNSSQLQTESAKGGYLPSLSSSSWKLIMVLLIMASVSTLRH